MKISAIKTFPKQIGERRYHFVKVETDEGIYGIGESGIINTVGLAVDQAVRHLSTLLIGEDPLCTERLWQVMFRRLFFPGDRVVCSAISAIDIALWDIKGKALGLPLYKLLGGPVRDKVVCYPHTSGATLDELLSSCRQAVKDGWRFVRTAVTETPRDSGILEPTVAAREVVKTLAAIRDAVGPDIEIICDAHTRLDTPIAIRLCNAVEPLNLFFMEDPLRSENPASYGTLARHTSVPIAAGEQWASKWQFRQVIEEELISYARIDLCIVGGITEALKVTHWCETHYIDVVPHNPLGPVSTAACNHLCLAASNVAVQEMPWVPGTALRDVFPVQMPFEKGYMLKPEGNGLGLVFDEEALGKYSWNPRIPPALRRKDGAMTNW